MTTEELNINGVPVRVETDTKSFSIEKRFYVPLDSVADLEGNLPGFTHTDVIILTIDGQEVGRAHTLWSMDYMALQLIRERALLVKKLEYQKELAELLVRSDELKAQGVDASQLERLLDRLARLLVDWRPRSALSNGRPEGLIRQARAELETLHESDPIELVVDRLLAGYRRGKGYNDLILRRLETLEVRSGGEIRLPTRDELVDHFRRALAHVTVTQQIAATLDLSMADFLPGSIQEVEQAFDLAPAKIFLEGRKRPEEVDVTYYFSDDEERTPTARISIPHSLYQRNQARHGRPSPLPELPYGIQWFVEVTYNGRVLVSGPPTPELTKRFDKNLAGARSARRSQLSASAEGYASLLGEFPGDGVPPWYKGPKIRA